MSEMMTFPDTWEEFEKHYGFTDNEEVYTNGARLIPSFRVKQLLEHLLSVQQEQLDCKDCIKHGGDWECDRVHCHKGDVPDTNVGELISRQAAIDGVKTLHDVAWKNWHEPTLSANVVLDMIRELPSVQPKQKWETCFDCPLSCGCPKINGYTNGQTMEYASEVPDDCPISVQPRKGKWIGYKADDKDWQRDDGSPVFMNCSECHEAVINNGSAHWNFCPNCGADMREGES